MSEQEKKTTKETKEKKTAKSANDNKIKKLEAELKEQKDLVLRTAAEFDNYKKRTEKEKLAVGEFATANVLKKLLPTIDNAKRATSFPAGSEEYNKGIELIAKQLIAATETFNMKELAMVGDEFDPNIHEAVLSAESETLKENQISEVLQQGYKVGDTVIRPAMVAVVK